MFIQSSGSKILTIVLMFCDLKVVKCQLVLHDWCTIIQLFTKYPQVNIFIKKKKRKKVNIKSYCEIEFKFGCV